MAEIERPVFIAWRSIETAPKDGTEILFWSDRFPSRIGIGFYRDGHIWTGGFVKQPSAIKREWADVASLWLPRPPLPGDTCITPPPADHALALSEDQIAAVLHLVESRLCIIWTQVGAREAFANELRVMEPVSDDEAELCTACDVPFEDGDMVYWNSDDTGHLHADCCGPERESYVNADGAPLKDSEPIPEPFAWRAGR